MGDLPNKARSTSVHRRHLWPVISLLIAAYVAFNLILNPSFHVSYAQSWGAHVMVGVLAMQSIQLGVWAAIGPGKKVVRLPLFLALLLLIELTGSFKQWNLWASDFFGIAGTMPAFRLDVEMLVVLFGIFTFSAIGTWELGRLARCRLIRGSGNTEQSRMGMQVSVKYLLILISVCAVLLALGHRIVSTRQDPQPPSWSVALFQFSIVPIFMNMLLLPSTAMSVILLRARTSFRIVVMVVMSAAVLSLLVAGFVTAVIPPPKTETIVVFCSLEAGAAVGGLFTSVLLRVAGYRLTRESSDLTSKNDYLLERP